LSKPLDELIVFKCHTLLASGWACSTEMVNNIEMKYYFKCLGHCVNTQSNSIYAP